MAPTLLQDIILNVCHQHRFLIKIKKSSTNHISFLLRQRSNGRERKKQDKKGREERRGWGGRVKKSRDLNGKKSKKKNKVYNKKKSSLKAYLHREDRETQKRKYPTLWPTLVAMTIGTHPVKRQPSMHALKQQRRMKRSKTDYDKHSVALCS